MFTASDKKKHFINSFSLSSFSKLDLLYVIIAEGSELYKNFGPARHERQKNVLPALRMFQAVST
jgi:hypothetical protein